MRIEVESATIESTQIGFDDHGIFTFWLHLRYGSWGGQGFGGIANIDSRHVRSILDVLDCSFWETLEKQKVHVRAIHRQDRVLAIGNFTDDKWVEPTEDGNWNVGPASCLSPECRKVLGCENQEEKQVTVANETKNKTFWMVYRLNGNSPTFRHESQRNAEKEAQRLADFNPGETFFVLRAETAVIVEKQPATWKTVEQALEDYSDIPF